MDKICILAYAKINLFLDISSVRPDGYHCVETVMQALGIFDRVIIEKKQGGIELFCDDPSVPTDGRNIAYKAALSFFEKAGLCGGCSILIEKHIPKEAGMGGGSSDGAAVIRGLNLLYGKVLDKEGELAAARPVGADLAFFLGSAPELMTGLGDVPLRTYPLPEFKHILIIKPSEGISTPAAYRAIDAKFSDFSFNKEKLSALEKALCEHGKAGISENIYNIFEEILPDVCPVCTDIIAIIKKYGKGAGLCGSGSAVYGLFDSRETCEAAARAAAGRYPGAKIYITCPVSAGLETEAKL